MGGTLDARRMSGHGVSGRGVSGCEVDEWIYMEMARVGLDRVGK